MRLKVDPLCNVFIVRDLANDKLLPEVLVVNDIGCVTDDVLDLFCYKGSVLANRTVPKRI
jgi:hypothetical protein